jgi:hypothetical protein
MKSWLSIVIVLVVAGTVAATVDLPAQKSKASSPDSDWRRTTRGWEHRSQWQPAAHAGPVSQLSPAIVAALQALISVGALVAEQREA